MDGSKLTGRRRFVALAMAVIVFGGASPLATAASAGSVAAFAGSTFWVAPPSRLADPLGDATASRGLGTAGFTLELQAPMASAGSAVARSITTAARTHLTFRYAHGWSASERATMADFIAAAYPIMVEVVGPPARSFAITIVPDDTLGGWAFLQWRASCSGAVSAELHVGHADVADVEGRLYYLPHEILHGFHAPLTLPTDADEEGFTEAASTLVRARLGPLVGGAAGVADVEASGYNDQSISALTGADELNQPVLAAPSFYNHDHWSRPQVTELYAAAAVYWFTLTEVRPSLFRDFNARWYRAATLGGATPGEVRKVQAIVAALVPRLGSHAYADWLAAQQIRRTHHAAGVHLLCTDVAPQLAPDPGTAETPAVIVNPTLIETAANGDDRTYDGSVSVTLVGPDGASLETRTGNAKDGSLFGLGSADVPAAGAYTFRVTVQGATGTSTSDACWAIAGVASSGRLLVIGTPGSSVTATLIGRDAATGSPVRATVTQAVAADGIAIFEGVGPGLADVGPAGAPPVKIVPVGTHGAIVALVSATRSLPGITR